MNQKRKDQLLNGITTDVAKYLQRLDKTHHNTCVHSICAAYYALWMFENLNLDVAESIIIQGALLHDIGKSRIPYSVINKNGCLTAGERELINKHPLYGAQILNADNNIRKEVVEIALYHHERMNGSGYPFGISTIPPEISVVSMADVYEALTGKREYKKAYSHEEAISVLDLAAAQNILPDQLCNIMRNEMPLNETERQTLYALAMKTCSVMEKIYGEKDI